MGYVVVVFAIINSGFLLLVGMLLLNMRVDLVESVGTAIEDEVRKQDDRIEKRVAKVQGTRQNDEEERATGRPDGLVAGSPFRR